MEWYTSGKRDSDIADQFLWEGDGTPVEGSLYWHPTADMNIAEGDRIVYFTDDRESITVDLTYYFGVCVELYNNFLVYSKMLSEINYLLNLKRYIVQTTLLCDYA